MFIYIGLYVCMFILYIYIYLTPHQINFSLQRNHYRKPQPIKMQRTRNTGVPIPTLCICSTILTLNAKETLLKCSERF